MKLQKQNPDNGQPSNISTASRDHCSNEHGSTEVFEASMSQNNEQVQETPCTHPDGGATLSIKTEQITPASQRETTSPGQLDVSILCDTSSYQKAYEKPLQELQLEPDGALADPGKELPAFQLCNGVDGLFGANEHANEPRTDPFCKPTSDSDATTIAQVIPTEDTAVSNATISSNEDSTSGNEAKETECVKQHDELGVVKELSAKNIDDKVNAEEQTDVLNNPLGDMQAVVKDLSVMDTGHMADASEQASVQNNLLDTGHVNCVKKICFEDSVQVVCFEDCAQVMCSEDSVQVVDDPCHGNLHKNIKIKSKKGVKFPVVNFYFGSKQLLLASLKPRKKWKHKRTRRWSTSSMDIESIANDQQTSTSETILTSGISCKSQRWKHSCNTTSSEDGVQTFNKKQILGDSNSASDLTMDKKDSKETLASAELASSVANLVSEKCAHTNEKLLSHDGMKMTCQEQQQQSCNI